MDPLSIAAGVLTLLTVSVKVSVLLKQFRDEIEVVDATLSGFLSDIANFQQVLESLRDTFDQDEIKANIELTGHAGSHWKNLARSLDDGTRTLQQLMTVLEGINKTTKFLDGPRKQLRFKSAMDQLGTFRDQIQSYRAALQLSLSTIILCNQVSLQKSTDGLPEKIMPTLDKLYDEFRSLGTSLNAKIETLRTSLALQNRESCNELISMNNLRECVRSAADVVSTASSTLTVDMMNKSSVKHGSDFGEIFMQETNETMMRWMSSSTVYEFEELTSRLDPSESSTIDVTKEYQSDSDSDLETEMIKALFESAIRLKDDGDLRGAERKLRNCLTRSSMIASTASLTSLKRTVASGISRLKILELLLDTYCMLEAWSKAKQVLVEKLSLAHKKAGTRDELFLWDTFKLAELMAKCKEYDSAHLQGRRCLRGFRRLGEEGYHGYEQCVVFLIKLCNEEGRPDEEEAYADLLGSHHTKIKAESSSSLTDIIRSVPASLQLEADQDELGASEQQNTPNDNAHSNFESVGLKDKREQGVDQQCLSETGDVALLKDVMKISSVEHSSDFSRPASTLIAKARIRDANGEDTTEFSEDYVASVASSTTAIPTSTVHQEYFEEVDFMSELYLSGPMHASLQKSQSLPISRLELLTTYCQITHGTVPRFQVTPFEGKWDCQLELGNIARWRVSSCSTELLARTAVVDVAWKYLITPSVEECLISGDKLQEPYSDKEAAPGVNVWEKSRMSIPVWDGSGAGVSRTKQHRDEPEVMSSAGVATSYAQDVAYPSLRHTASDTKVPHAVPCNTASLSKFLRNATVEPPARFRDYRRTASDSQSARSTGEGFLAPIDAQASRPSSSKQTEADLATYDTIKDFVFSTQTTSDGRTDAIPCPVCDEDLAKWSEDTRVTHVNNCLDGPVQARDVSPSSTDPGLSIPIILTEPGACNKCNSGQLGSLEYDTCRLCGSHRTSNDVDNLEPPGLDNLITVEGSIIQRKIFLIGDPACGKTRLASAWSGQGFPASERHCGTINYATFVKEVAARNCRMELEVGDYTGNESYDRQRHMLYTDVRLVLICFDLSSFDSLENVEEKWIHETNRFLRDVPKILVGCKRDIRNKDVEFRKDASGERPILLRDEAKRVTQCVKALAYFETSAFTSEGIGELFEYVAEVLSAVEVSSTKPAAKKGVGIRKFWTRS